jgi:hypothetical protein
VPLKCLTDTADFGCGAGGGAIDCFTVLKWISAVAAAAATTLCLLTGSAVDAAAVSLWLLAGSAAAVVRALKGITVGWWDSFRLLCALMSAAAANAAAATAATAAAAAAAAAAVLLPSRRRFASAASHMVQLGQLRGQLVEVLHTRACYH